MAAWAPKEARNDHSRLPVETTCRVGRESPVKYSSLRLFKGIRSGAAKMKRMVSDYTISFFDRSFGYKRGFIVLHEVKVFVCCNKSVDITRQPAVP